MTSIRRSHLAQSVSQSVSEFVYVCLYVSVCRYAFCSDKFTTLKHFLGGGGGGPIVGYKLFEGLLNIVK